MEAQYRWILGQHFKLLKQWKSVHKAVSSHVLEELNLSPLKAMGLECRDSSWGAVLCMMKTCKKAVMSEFMRTLIMTNPNQDATGLLLKAQATSS